MLIAFAVCESLGWPFLAGPAQRALASRLERNVSFDGEGGNTFVLKLLGGPRLSVGRLQIDNPAWSEFATMLVASKLQVGARWSDVITWRPGQTLQLVSVSADSLNLHLQRVTDGRASWHFGDDSAADPTAPSLQAAEVVQIERISVREGSVRLLDAALQLDVAAKFAETDPQGPLAGQGLRARAEGSYRGQPLLATLNTGSAPAWLNRAVDAPGVPMALRLKIGRAVLRFDGQTRRPLGARELQGRFHLAGPSLAAVGQPLDVVLPETRRFAMDGLLTQSGTRWQVVVSKASVGQSLLDGAFVYDKPALGVPTLAGRLHGALLMQDLGPAVGGATDDAPKTTKASGRLLPDRSFDLPALRSMNANVLIDMERLDFGTPALRAAAPLRGHLVLQDGVLALNDLQAGLAQGQFSGHVRLDGRRDIALWDVDLRGKDLLLEQWITAVQRPNLPPYATGRLSGRITLKGQGRSTAALLGSADGSMQLAWTQGTLSHLLVEAAGLDLAQAIGILIRGDKPLQVDCGVGQLKVSQGRMTPSVLLVDTADSAIWVDGSLSLADEQLALVAHVQPKDWSPLSLRTPLHIDGAWSSPSLSLEKAPLLRRVLPATLLALINPFAALLPLMDFAKDGPSEQACTRALAQLQRVKR